MTRAVPRGLTGYSSCSRSSWRVLAVPLVQWRVLAILVSQRRVLGYVVIYTLPALIVSPSVLTALADIQVGQGPDDTLARLQRKSQTS